MNVKPLSDLSLIHISLFYLSPAGFIYIYWYIVGAAAAWLFADWGCRGRGVRSEGVPMAKWCLLYTSRCV